jgi:hypothetical protein
MIEMIKTFLAFSAVLVAASAPGACQAHVGVEATPSAGSGHLQEQTRQAAIRDYLESWKTFSSAFEQNRPDMLNRDFVGGAKDKLASTIQEQSSMGISTRYRDRAHDLKVLFYSPEGLSIELADNVEYDVQVQSKDKSAAAERIRARYIVVLTPAELRWKVRVFQAQGE